MLCPRSQRCVAHTCASREAGMHRPVRRWLSAIVAAILLSVPSITLAQGTTKTNLSGVVTDSTGGVIPGATVTIKNERTGVVTTVITGSAGAFDAPALNPGMYSVTITLQGFKTTVLKDIEL